MPERKASILGIGNAISDIIVRIPEEFIASLPYKKASMQLVSQEEIEKLLEQVVDADLQYEIHSGGSVANTIYYLSKMKVRTSFIGNVAKGNFGQRFLSDLTKQGVKFINVHDKTDNRSAKCIVLVTPDGERTMCTYLGCAGEIALAKVPSFHVGNPEFIYTEAYLLDNPSVADELANFIKRDLLQKSNFVLSLSDSECVKRNLNRINELINDEVVIAIGNETEFAALIGEDHLNDNHFVELQKLFEKAKKLKKLVITFSDKGSVLITSDNVQKFSVTAVDAVDSTGAGDSFAAGYLGAIIKGYSEEKAVKVGHEIAVQVIAAIGARAEVVIPKLNEISKSD